MIKAVNTCPITGQTDSITYLDLGMMPLVNNLNSTREESLECQRYPLKINYYTDSKLSMLSHIVSPDVLFKNYFYKSSTSQPYIDHCRTMFNHVSSFVTLNRDDVVLDIGGNDGTLLFEFWKSSITPIWPINVDPSNLSQLSDLKKIETHREMWSSATAPRIMKKRKAKIITSTNVFQHLEDIRDFVSAIRDSLDDEGIWCLEFPYWKKDLETNQYDQTYHEHIYYYLVTPLNDLFMQEGLKIIDISEQNIHGGTLRLIIKKKDHDIIDPIVSSYILNEIKFDKNFYMDWGNRTNLHIQDCQSFLDILKMCKNKIAGFGAAAKGCTFLNSCKLNYETISYVVDDTDLKQGKYIPGTGIEIVNRNRLIIDPPDYVLILAHNFSDYIMKSLKPIYRGKFLVMFPTIQEI